MDREPCRDCPRKTGNPVRLDADRIQAGQKPSAVVVAFATVLWTAVAGCSLVPYRTEIPTVHNPFPQIHKVAVVPFFNLSTEPTLDGRKVAVAYYNELQEVAGFEVIPVGVAERAMVEARLALNRPEDARRLAQILGADAVVVGAVTEYSPYYPPRIGLQVEWYAANPGFHPVPPGYGLPWGTKEEKHIPDRLILESRLAYAREQMRTQTPPLVDDIPTTSGESQAISPTLPEGDAASRTASVPDYWPDPRGLIPPPPQPTPPALVPSNEPVLVHTRVFKGDDGDFAAALQSYASQRNDARFGGWQTYLERSDDFIRFCCRLHIWEMLTARGGAGKSQVVWRQEKIR
ncbi:MAG: hypothetical protein GYA33_12575 [Thermogutta sp.]|nr:hypothetical protein [Thermogutta sp.]